MRDDRRGQGKVDQQKNESFLDSLRGVTLFLEGCTASIMLYAILYVIGPPFTFAVRLDDE